MKTTTLCLAGLVALLAGPVLSAADEPVVTAVYSKVSNGYRRQKEADGAYKREYYALTKGMYRPGVAPDRSIDAVRYPQIAKIVAQFLALENYYLAPDSKSADLLLTITWGKTIPFSDAVYRANTDTFFSSSNTLAAANAVVKASENANQQQRTPDGIQTPARAVRDAARDEFEGELYKMVMFDDARRQADQQVASLLGYVDEINYRDVPSRFAGAGDAYLELQDDIETERYYVIIGAYDFRAMKNGGEKKLLWSTRVSVRAQGNRFNETLAAMLNRAAPYFGEDSGRLIRRYTPTTKVELGELKILGSGADAKPDDDSTKH